MRVQQENGWVGWGCARELITTEESAHHTCARIHVPQRIRTHISQKLYEKHLPGTLNEGYNRITQIAQRTANNHHFVKHTVIAIPTINH